MPTIYPVMVLMVTFIYGCTTQQHSTSKIDMKTTPKICERTACRLEPYNCNPEDNNCAYALSVKETSDKKSFKFNLRGSARGFVAVGLSTDKFIGSDDMIACVLNGSSVEVKHIYGEYTKLQVSQLTEGATILKASYDRQHEIIHCVFTRKKILKSVPQYFNMKRKWYLIFASGSTKHGMPLMNGPQKVTKRKIALAKPVIYAESDIKIAGKPKVTVEEKSIKMPDLIKGTTEIELNNTIPPGIFQPPDFVNLNKCGNYHQCVKVPENCEWNNCKYSLRIKENKAGDSLTFLLTGKSPGWIALAFSKDKLMNEDDTVFCISGKTKDSTNVKRAFTARHFIQEIYSAENLNVHSASAIDGYISCKFTRPKNVPDNNNMYNLYEPHFIFLGSGPLVSSIHRPMQHSTNPLISEYKVSFNSTRGIISIEDKDEIDEDKVGPLPLEQTRFPFDFNTEEETSSREIIGGPPELQLVPNKAVISYRPTVPASYMKYVRMLSRFIPDSSIHPTCNPSTKFGYGSACPCVIITFTENQKKWAPVPYLPVPLPRTIKNIYEDAYLPLTCEGKTNVDKRMLGAVVVTPSAGFLSDDLENSFVTVQLMGPKENVSIRVVCFIWAANIDHSRSEGRIDFTVKMKGPAH